MVEKRRLKRQNEDLLQEISSMRCMKSQLETEVTSSATEVARKSEEVVTLNSQMAELQEKLSCLAVENDELNRALALHKVFIQTSLPSPPPVDSDHLSLHLSVYVGGKFTNSGRASYAIS